MRANSSEKEADKELNLLQAIVVPFLQQVVNICKWMAESVKSFFVGEERPRKRWQY